MKKIVKLFLIILIVPIILLGLFVFYQENYRPNHKPPKYLGIDPVVGEEADIPLEKKKEILERNSWFFGPYPEVKDNFYIYMDFNKKEVFLAWGSHAIAEYDFGPPTIISNRRNMVVEDTCDYELREDGLYLWNKDASFIGVAQFKFTEDAILSADIPAWKNLPEVKGLKAYEDKKK